MDAVDTYFVSAQQRHGPEGYPRTSSMFKNLSSSTCPEIGVNMVASHKVCNASLMGFKAHLPNIIISKQKSVYCQAKLKLLDVQPIFQSRKINR